MRILITGGCGFIGSHFIKYMLEKYTNIYIVNYDSLTYAANLKNIEVKADNYKLVVGDINDRQLLSQTLIDNQIEYIVNFAAETHIDRSIYGSAVEFIQSNTLGVMSLLNILRDKGEQIGIKKMIHISTDEVYGSLELGENRKFTETTILNPSTPYASSKAGGDLLCSSYYNTFKIPVVATRCTNNYGTNQHKEKLIPLCVDLLKRGEKLLVHGDGKSVRDWIHVLDNCSAIDVLLSCGENGEIYNIGANNERPNLEVMKMIIKSMGMTFDNSMIKFVKDRPGNDRRYAVDSSKIRALGWNPIYTDFEKEINKMVGYYL